MNTKVLGLACLATLATPAAWALEKELQVGPDELRGGFELLNQHWSPGGAVVINPSATGRASLDARWYDVGLHIDGYLALDGNPGNNRAVITDLETTEVTARLDYLFEIENILQVLPFIEGTVYPYVKGSTKYNWVGAEAWYLTPLEGLEVGASLQYNLADNTIASTPSVSVSEHYWLHTFGVRYFYQEAPLDLSGWGLLNLANRAYHRQVTGANTQGATTFNLGGQLTLPLPWDSTWTFLKVDSYWYVDSDDRKALFAAGRDKTELVFALGFEYRN